MLANRTANALGTAPMRRMRPPHPFPLWRRPLSGVVFRLREQARGLGNRTCIRRRRGRRSETRRRCLLLSANRRCDTSRGKDINPTARFRRRDLHRRLGRYHVVSCSPFSAHSPHLTILAIMPAHDRTSPGPSECIRRVDPTQQAGFRNRAALVQEKRERSRSAAFMSAQTMFRVFRRLHAPSTSVIPADTMP